MEIHPGVFVSRVMTDEWRPDPEVGGEMHVLVEEETAYAGMSRFQTTKPTDPWILPERETMLVLEGAVRIEIDGGPTLDLKVGDMASLPKGAVTTWHMTVPFREIWFFGRPYEAPSD
ncbi:MAG: cupin domain-containing protein [Acidimicrobiales bacterium]